MASLGKNKNRTWRAGVLRSYVRFLHSYYIRTIDKQYVVILRTENMLNFGASQRVFSARLREVAEDAFDFAEDGYVLD